MFGLTVTERPAADQTEKAAAPERTSTEPIRIASFEC